jgi:hypothetical protein
MKMDFDLESGLISSSGSARLDWHGLRTRLTAAHAVRAMIDVTAQSRALIEGGSFDRSSARALAVYGKTASDGLGGINPTGLANGKPHQDIITAVVGARPAGD